MKKLIALMAAGLLCGVTFASAQEVDLVALKSQIADLQSKVDAMSKEMNKMQQHTVTDKVSLGVEFMTRVDSMQFNDVRGLNDELQGKLRNMMNNIANGPMYSYDLGSVTDTYATMSDGMGAYVPATMQNYQTMFQGQGFFDPTKVKKYDTNNDFFMTNRLRVRMSSKVNENISFTGRLVMYKAFGESISEHFFNGTMGSMNMDMNSGQVPGDDSIHVERAYFVYSNNIGPVPYHFSLGRRPAAYGAGMENHENAVLGGSPLGSIIQMNFDGASLGFDLEDVTGIPGLNFKVCYGQGFEGQYGTYNSLNSTADVNDVHFYGFILKAFDNDQYKLWYNYAYGAGITDGFVGTSVFPFFVRSGGYDNSSNPTYVMVPNFGGYISRIEPTSKVGDIELHSIMAQGKTFGFDWFAAYSLSKTHPDGSSANPMYKFMGQDKLLDGKSRTGQSIWVGVMTPELPYTKGKLGVEYNWGSKYWLPFMATTDAAKLATRGQVYEAYYHQPIVGDNFFATLGVMYTDYKYTGSGSPMGAPMKIEDVIPYNVMMPVVDKVTDFYLKMTYRY
ncbi:DUF3373 domain-containing protein [Calditerrivibrio sp.]|uniref:DUF3373 domain-containing protein n=1 Tax=Calditerrivibrio sp. TaxID=2792612 RepID=UPI003D0F8AC4